jgi:hypothetical protein
MDRFTEVAAASLLLIVGTVVLGYAAGMLSLLLPILSVIALCIAAALIYVAGSQEGEARAAVQQARTADRAAYEVRRDPLLEMRGYITAMRERGIPDGTIRDRLLAAGWAPNLVDLEMTLPPLEA